MGLGDSVSHKLMEVPLYKMLSDFRKTIGLFEGFKSSLVCPSGNSNRVDKDGYGATVE